MGQVFPNDIINASLSPPISKKVLLAGPLTMHNPAHQNAC
jgi:hypothetical protein